MAVDLAAIRKRVLELSGQARTSNVQLWKPVAGEYRVRAVPWKMMTDGMPLVERRFYYLGDTPRFLAPSQFGKKDPVNELSRKLYSSGKAEDRELAKKLHPKLTAYMAIIVRGQEDKGVQVWSCNPFLYQTLLGFFTDEETAEWMDPEEGLDLKITITPSKKVLNGRTLMDTVVKTAQKSSKLSQDPEQAKRWCDSVPDISDLYPQKTTEEIEALITSWLSGGISSDPSKDEGTPRGSAKPKDELDALAEDVKSAARTPAPKKPAAKRSPIDIDDETAAPKKDLDTAFDELVNSKNDDD